MKMTKKQMIAVVILIIIAVIVYKQMKYDPLDDYSLGSLNVGGYSPDPVG